MADSTYECMFLLDSNKVSGDVATSAKVLHGILERNHAEVLASRQWDERKLAYSVKSHKKGLYYLIYFKTEGKNLKGIEHDCALNEMIIRMLILRIDPKLVDSMLNVARDEHAFALQAVPDLPSEADVPPDLDKLDESRPRRGGSRRPAGAYDKG